MNLDEHRSPKVILEYFELLKWNKNGCNPDILTDTLDSNQELQSIRRNLDKIQALMIEKESLNSFNQKEIDRIKPIITSTEQNLSKLRKKIILTRRERLQDVEIAPQSKAFEQKKSRKSAIPPLGLSRILHQFFLSIADDLRATYLDIKRAIARLDFPILSQYFLAIFVVITVCFSFAYLINSSFYISLISYITWKLFCSFRRYEKAQNQRYENDEINRQSQAQQQRQQELESNLRELEKQYAAYEQDLNQQRLEEQELTTRIRAARGDLINLERSRNQQAENYRKTRENITRQEQLSKIERLSCLEKLTQQWLDQDIDRLTNQAMRKLNLRNINSGAQVGALKATPIRALIGVTKRTSSSLLVEDSVEGNVRNNEALALHINEGEFKSEPAYTGEGMEYSIYEFLVIFLCSNFLSYYKCYFNFIRAEHIDDQYCEYLYDSIVFTKIQEKSSVNMQNVDDPKQVYSKRLIISTNDGKVVCFRIARSRVKSNLSSKLSRIDDAATAIRKMLRKRELTSDDFDSN